MKKIATKQKKIFLYLGLAIAILFLLPLSLVVWSESRRPPLSSNVPNSKDARLADPNLLYASFSDSGLCSNDKGEEGGCYSRSFLYNSGEYVSESSWSGIDNKRKIYPTTEKKFSKKSMDKIIKQIKDLDIMNKDCPSVQNTDAWFSYQLNLDGVKKFFKSSPTYECQKIFWEIDKLINSIAKSTN